MRTKNFLGAATLALALVAFVSPASALEKRAGLAVEDDRAWEAGGSVTISYYNICTGWVWIWSGWSPNDVVGVSYDTNFGFGGSLQSNWWFFGAGSPAGYGFTGSIEVSNIDTNECPVGAPLETQSFLPASGWNLITWGGFSIVDDFSVTLTFGPGAANPAELWTDHPAAGPTGPQACGSCYPNPRVIHSYYFGTPNSPLCPGQPLNDGVCDAEFLQTAEALFVDIVEPTSWGSVKDLYR